MKTLTLTAAALIASALVATSASAQTTRTAAAPATAPAMEIVDCAMNFQGVTCSDYCAMSGGLWLPAASTYGSCGFTQSADAAVFRGLNTLAAAARANGEVKRCRGPYATTASCQELCEDLGGTYVPDVGRFGGCSGLGHSSHPWFGGTRALPTAPVSRS